MVEKSVPLGAVTMQNILSRHCYNQQTDCAPRAHVLEIHNTKRKRKKTKHVGGGGEKKSKMLEIAHVWVQAWENLFQRVASCEEERLCVLASLCPSTTLHLFLYWYKRNTAERTQKPILLCGEATLSTKLHRKHRQKARHPGSVDIVFTEKMIRGIHRHTWIHDASSSSSWIFPKRLFPWSVGDSFLFFFGTSEDPLLSFTVSSKSTHSLPIGPDLHMKWYPSFSSTLAPLSTHMPGSEEAGKAHNWSVSLGWKSVTKVSPPRSTQEWLQIQIYCKLKWKFCRANTKHFFFLHDPDKKESTNMLQFLLKMFCFALRKNISSHNLKLHFKTA